jgi:hypothetical protein
MLRGVFMAVIALHVAVATGEASALGTVCTQQCADDDANGHCGPTCNDCACCSHGSALATPFYGGFVVATPTSRIAQLPIPTPPTPDRAEILHIPIG